MLLFSVHPITLLSCIYWIILLHQILFYFHSGFRLEQTSYSVGEDVGTLNICTTYKGENVPRTLDVKVNLRPNGKSSTMSGQQY